MPPGDLEEALLSLGLGNKPQDPRVIAGQTANEDAVVVRFPDGKALIQTVDFFTPIVNNPYWFGQIAAANALSDVYAMGGTPYTAMNILCFPIKTQSKETLKEILAGGLDKIQEAEAILAGGHSLEDEELKYGLAVSGLVDPDGVTTNTGLLPGDQLILTKPIGTGVLATALKAEWEGAEQFEKILYKWASHLNKKAGSIIPKLGLRAATDVTGFGLGGHLLEMLHGSGACAAIWLDETPFIPEALELAAMGMIPMGSYANKTFCKSVVQVAADKSSIKADLIFDAQTSGGLLLAVPEKKVKEATMMLEDLGELAAHVGEVLPCDAGATPRPKLLLC